MATRIEGCGIQVTDLIEAQPEAPDLRTPVLADHDILKD
jgi:hypothetical protein